MKAFLPRQKNDAADARAIARAVRDPEMRFVGVKSLESQASLMLFKPRDLVMGQEENQTLAPAMCQALKALVATLAGLEDEIKVLNAAILKQHKASEASQRLATVPGIGTLTATLLVATVSAPAQFSGGREFAAWIGLVPRQHSTGGKARLGKISKMGNRDLRRLLVVGAHAALYRMKSGKTQSPLADWARSLLAKKPFKLVAVALANKMARIAVKLAQTA